MKEEFDSLLIGKFLPIHWPARSPDLNPLDYFLWGFARDRVYADGGFENVNSLNTKIIEVFNEIRTSEMLCVQNACRAFWSRAEAVINSHGAQLLHR